MKKLEGAKRNLVEAFVVALLVLKMTPLSMSSQISFIFSYGTEAVLLITYKLHCHQLMIVIENNV